MLAYHSDPALKKSAINEMATHRKAGHLLQGYGCWKDGKGGAVGCLIKGGNHAEYETRFGIPRLLARLEDVIFEGLPVDDAKKWPERFLMAINPGVNLSMVFYQLTHWLLVDSKDGVLQYAKTDKERKSIQLVGNVYKRKISGKKISKADWRVGAVYAYAADAVDDVYAYAADAYADDVYADGAAARKNARFKARQRQADKLIELLKAAA